ncbi:MAG: hypothetical protein KDB53_15355 [Planctomycetes bacterium]|nr:hypothetical protein [Planctomycetota bacterium]
MSRARIVAFAGIVVVATVWLSSVGCSSPSREEAWAYEVQVGADAAQLRLQAELPAGVARELSVNRGAEPFVHDVVLVDGEDSISLARRQDSWWIPESQEGPYLIRWTFDLAAAAAAMRHPRRALQVPGGYLSPPSAWLLRPMRFFKDTPVHLRVAEDSRPYFATGLHGGVERGSHRFMSGQMAGLTYTALGRFSSHRFAVRDAVLQVVVFDIGERIDPPGAAAWVAEAAAAVADWYGGLPVSEAMVFIVPRGHGVGHGTALGRGGAAVLLPVARNDTIESLRQDWVLVHELVHFAFPQVAERHHWIEEGLATYVEPLVRWRVGLIDEDQFWTDLVRGLPQGLPKANDRGLDHTATWGRTYWGGALFCFLADLEIIRRSEGRLRLRDALSAIVASGGNFCEDWDISVALRTGDRSLGFEVLEPLYQAMKADPYPVDLPAIWDRLGVRVRGREVRYDDDAPEAWIRRAIDAR